MATFTKRIVAGADDGYSRGVNFDNNDNFIYLSTSGANLNDGFFRFINVTIPRESTIVDAKLTFRANLNKSGTIFRTNIYCEDADTAVAPTSRAEHNADVRTTAFTVWDGEGAWVQGTNYDTPDFKSAVEEVIGRGGWSSGNALMVLIDNDGGDNFSERTPDSYDFTATECALLTVNYTSAAGSKIFFFT